MISTLLCTMAVLWLPFLHRYPHLFARRRARKRPHFQQYSYVVCGEEALPTWRRKGESRAQTVARRG